MRVFAIANPTSQATYEVRTRLESIGLTEGTDAEVADVVVVAVGVHEGGAFALLLAGLRERVSAGLVAILSSECGDDDWREVLQHAPSVVSAAAPRQEVLARAANAAGARLRYELSIAGERRLALLRKSLEEVSMIDMRTGMYNRRYLVTRLREAISASRRYNRPLTLCVFKIVDYDGLLRAETDDTVVALIEILSDRLAASLRSADVQAWIANDEVALMLPETPEEGAERVVNRVLEQADEIGRERSVAFRLIGSYASPSTDDTSSEAFVERARAQLHAAGATRD